MGPKERSVYVRREVLDIFRSYCIVMTFLQLWVT